MELDVISRMNFRVIPLENFRFKKIEIQGTSLISMHSKLNPVLSSEFLCSHGKTRSSMHLSTPSLSIIYNPAIHFLCLVWVL